MMDAADLLHKIGETLGSTATVKSVFGEPISAHGKTVVPVAKVVYGFGGGFGARDLTSREWQHDYTPRTL
jgi:uncharacterized spore protein YtfJ